MRSAGVAQIAVAVAMQHSARSALNVALSVASLINGPILGVFFLGATKRAGTVAASAGMMAGLLAVAVVGSLTTFMVGSIRSVTRR